MMTEPFTREWHREQEEHKFNSLPDPVKERYMDRAHEVLRKANVPYTNQAVKYQLAKTIFEEEQSWMDTL